MFRLVSLVMTIVFVLMLSMPVVALASNSTSGTTSGSTSTTTNGTSSGDSSSNILNTVQSYSDGTSAVNNLQQSATNAGDSVVKFLRTIFVIFLIIMIIVVGYALLFSPNVKSLGDAKGRIGALIVAIILVTLTEQIAGTIFSWLGYKM